MGPQVDGDDPPAFHEQRQDPVEDLDRADAAMHQDQ